MRSLRIAAAFSLLLAVSFMMTGCPPKPPVNEPAAGTVETFELPGGVLLEMVWCPRGNFMMGQLANEPDINGELDLELPRHKVTFASGFWMGKYEVTKRQWEAVMGTTPWTVFNNYVSDDPDSPAVFVSWDDARAFIAALNALKAEDGRDFRLPSEAEWEYACRAGTETRFYWGADPDYTLINDYAWWEGNVGLTGDEQYAHVVGQKLPNAWGLYDMSGNVLEWIQDTLSLDYNGAPTDGSAWEAPGEWRGYRGGHWMYGGPISCRSAYRDGSPPSIRADSDLGFRLAR